MPDASARSGVFERTLEDLTDDAEAAGNVLAREAVDNLYIKRNIDPDQAIAIERALAAQGIAIEDEPDRPDLSGETEPQNNSAYESAFDYLLHLARRYPLLTADQEAACGEVIQRALELEERPDAERTDIDRRAIIAGKKARATLINSNIRLVTKIIFDPRYRNRHDRDDMVQLGLIGLMRAAEKFDPAHGCRFSTYAMWWIRQGVHRGIENDGRTIRIPSHMLHHISRFKRARRSLALSDGTDSVSIARIAEILGWSDAYTARVGQLADMRTVSLDASVGQDEGVTLSDVVPDKSPGPEDLAISADVAKRVRSIIEDLGDDRLEDIVRRRFGLDGPEETLESIGQSYGVTRERIRQLEFKALKLLRLRAGRAHLRSREGS